MVVRSNRFMALALVLSIACSQVSFAASELSSEVLTQISTAVAKATAEGVVEGLTKAEALKSAAKSAVKSLSFQEVVNQVKSHPYMYASLLVAALMVYDLESKGPCENVSYDFGALMRGNDSYTAKLQQAVAWVRRYVIGQPYKSSTIKYKDGGAVIAPAQEAFGVMGTAQANLKPALVGLGAASFLKSVIEGKVSQGKLDEMGWALVFIALGLWK